MQETELYCHLHKNSQYVEGNINSISIHENLIKTFNRIFSMKIHFDYSYNKNTSNLIVENLPCLYSGSIAIKRENIFYFFKSSLKYQYFPLFPQNKISNHEVALLNTELDILQDLLLFDFQYALDYINFHKKQSSIGNLVKMVSQPFKKISTYLEDIQVVREIEKRLNITSKKEAIDFIKDINRKIEHYLSTIGKEFYMDQITSKQLNPLLILIYACLKTQNQFFSNKIEKYGLNSEKNLVNFVGAFDYNLLNGKLDIQGRIESDEFVKKKESDSKYDKFEKNIEDTRWLTKKFIIQAIGYSALFGVLYCLKNKIIQ